MSQFSNQQKADEAQREVKMRKYVYPQRVAQNKMSQQKAAEWLAIMEEIAADYREKAQKDAEKQNLFAGID